jgi:hypothetical protein
MNKKDLEETLEALRVFGKELTSSPEKARAYLVQAGIITPDGKLTEQYSKGA